MQRDIKGEWAVVTGSSGGIGYEYCRELAMRGANIVMVSIEKESNEELARDIKEQYGVETLPLALDLCRKESTELLQSAIRANGIEPLILINNAGIFSFNYLTEVPEGKINAFVDLHVRSVTMLSRAFAEQFKQRGRGYILNMSSMSCWMPMPGLSLYSSTKAYIRAFSRALNYEMRDSGVRVMVACPGGIATDLFGLPENLKKLAVRIGAIERPERFVRKAVKHLLRGRSQYINGLTNRMAIVFIGVLPAAARMQVKRQLLDKNIRK